MMVNNVYVLTGEKSKTSRNRAEFHFPSWELLLHEKKGLLGLGFFFFYDFYVFI